MVKNILLVILLLSTTLLNAQDVRRHGFNVQDFNVVREGNSIILNFEVDVNSLVVEKNQIHQFALALISPEDDKTYLFESLIIADKSRYKYVKRAAAFGNYNAIQPIDVIRKSDKNQIVHLSLKAPYEEWMRGVDLYVNEKVTGCANCDVREDQYLVVKEVLPAEFIPDYKLAYIVPEIEETKQRSETYAAHLDFKVGKYDLLVDYKDNAARLMEVDSIVKNIKDDSRLTVNEFIITGYASPEGSYDSNLKLSENRANAFAGFLKKQYNLSSEKVSVRWRGEDWNGLREVVANSNLSDRSKILDIIDNTGNTVAYIFDLNVSKTGNGNFTGETSGTPGASSFTSKAQKIKKQNYKAAVFLNMNAAIKAATDVKGTPLSRLTDAAAFASMDNLVGASEDNFLMTNATGLIDITSSSIQNNPGDAETNSVRLTAERAVAKLIVKTAGITVNPSTAGTVSDAKWEADVINKKMYWLRKQTFKLGGTVMETAADYTNTGRADLYAEDPNWDGVTGTPQATSDFTVLANNATLAKADAASVYLPENTMKADDQMQDVTTRVVLSLKFKPKALVDASSASDSYYTYGGFVIPVELFKKYADGTETPSNTAFAAALQQLATNEGASDATLLDGTHASSFVLYGISFYKDGVCYYSIPIRHFIDSQEGNPMAYGRFGVVRNNTYNVRINSVSQPGAPLIPLDPETPDEINSYVSFTVDISPWFVRDEQVVDL
ncbi:MAG: Mfa1 family fimbria major subunit [Dysgonomonas sp.]